MRHNKRVMPIVKYAKELGYSVNNGRRNSHLRFSKDGHQTVVCSSTPSDPRSVKNAICQLRRSYRAVAEH